MNETPPARLPEPSSNPAHQAVRARLRAGDPYREPLVAAEVASLRRALHTAPKRTKHAPKLAWSLAAASLVLALVALLARDPVPPAPPDGVRAAMPPQNSQLHFVTPGGTRVVWVLRADDLKL
jgi:hypothetical protein